MSNLSAVLARYEKAIDKQGTRRARQHRDFFTKAEQAALAYYQQTLLSIRALENQNG